MSAAPLDGHPPLRGRAMQSGVVLSVRNGVGMVLSLAGMLFLTRRIGPGAFGVYASGLGILVFLQGFAQWGLNTYLLRVDERDLGKSTAVALSVTMVAAGSGVLAGLAALPALAAWIRAPGFPRVAAVLFLSLPLVALAQVPLTLLERRLAYRAVAAIELGGQVGYYAVAIVLAQLGFGAWAPVAGWWVQCSLLAALLYRASGIRPRLAWDGAIGRAMIRNGLSYSAAIWVWSGRVLVNPLVVGHFAGAQGVGQVAVAIRITEVLGFFRSAVYRVSMSVFGRMLGDAARLRRALGDAMHAQAVVLGAVFAAFAIVAPVLVPLVFGPAWLPVARIFPLIALGYLVNGLFSLHSAALFMLADNTAVLRFHLLHVVLFAGSAFLLVPRAGLMGYGYAECVAMASYVLIHVALVRHVGSPRMLAALSWGAACSLAMFCPRLGPLALTGLVLVPLHPGNRTALTGLMKEVRAIALGT